MWPESLSLYLCFTVTFYPTVVSLFIEEATAEAEVVFQYSPNSSETMELFFYLPITLPAAVILLVIATTIGTTSILGANLPLSISIFSSRSVASSPQ